jgi:hypothetical protein
MSDTHSRTSERFGWLWYPLLTFAASRVLILAFAWSAPLFGGKLGSPSGPPSAFVYQHPLWGALAHGDISTHAGIASGGYKSVADASVFPLVPLLGKGLGALFGSIEAALIVLSLLACAAAFAGIYRLFDSLHGRETARWGVALLAAFPFSYHLSDGSALACVLALSAWGTVLALRGSFAWAAAALSLAVLAHPAGIFSAVAVACLPAAGGSWRKWPAVLVPGLALLLQPIYVRSHLGVSTAVLWGALWDKAAPSSSAWAAMLVALGGLAGAGVLLLGRHPKLRLLVLAGGLELGFVLHAWSPAGAHALVLCWPAFLGLAGLLAERQALRAPLVAMLGAQQGLLLYCFTHFLRLT